MVHLQRVSVPATLYSIVALTVPDLHGVEPMNEHTWSFIPLELSKLAMERARQVRHAISDGYAERKKERA